MSYKVKRYILLIFIVLAGSTALTLCGSNRYHQRYAVGVLTVGGCLECHSGNMGKTIILCTGKECLYTKNHSILHPYPPARKAREYAPISEIIQAGCILENGKMTCQSCHDLTKPAPHTIRNGDQLCLICHIRLKPVR